MANPSWIPNDPWYSSVQQGHYNAVNLAQAWDTVKGNPNVVVRKLDAAEASAAARDAHSAREMNDMRLKLDAAEASAAALTAALVECRVAAADATLHRMRAEQTEAPTALLDCSFASRRRASGLMPG